MAYEQIATRSWTEDNCQGKISASGILKGNGSGSVSAATAGTDYEAAGKITIGGTQYNAAAHTVTIVTDGVTSSFNLVGVTS